MIPSVHQIHGVTRDGTIIIDSDSSDYYDCAEDQKLGCQSCGHEWNNFTQKIDFMDYSDWQALKEGGHGGE
jgi:hypothetical protein